MSRMQLLILTGMLTVIGACGRNEPIVEDAKSPEPVVEYFNLHQLCASQHATVERVQEFIDLGADVSQVKKFDLFKVKLVVDQSLESVKKIARVDPDAMKYHLMRVSEGLFRNVSPLMLAVITSDVEVVEFLLKAGAILEYSEEQWEGALEYAARFNPDPEKITILLKAGASIDGPRARFDDGDASPLRIAATLNNVEVVTALLKAGATIDCCSRGDTTPLHYAAMSQSDVEVINTLIRAGADV
ncbi:MAG: ankyrin repeat domain-containing protein, partial [Phycisphaerae bacterium]|nr:ankyrin repeat domain-containing protein [Phycisphaerae bacterium]